MPLSDTRNGPFAAAAPEERAFLLPLRVPRGGYQSEPGTLARLYEGLAVPGAIYGPYSAARTLMSPEGQYRPGADDAEGAALGMDAAGMAGAGALATRPAEALASGFARRVLPMDLESRMQRAAEMGFNVEEPLYHGTRRSFRAFDIGRSLPDEQAVWATPDPGAAAGFANRPLSRADFFSDERTLPGARIMPLLVRPGRQMVVDSIPEWDSRKFGRALDRARRQGFDSVRFKDVSDTDMPVDMVADQIAVFDPANLRSINARFDPRYRASPSLLSANPPAALLPSLLANDRRP
jgi:hypothetical protein